MHAPQHPHPPRHPAPPWRLAAPRPAAPRCSLHPGGPSRPRDAPTPRAVPVGRPAHGAAAGTGPDRAWRSETPREGGWQRPAWTRTWPPPAGFQVFASLVLGGPSPCASFRGDTCHTRRGGEPALGRLRGAPRAPGSDGASARGAPTHVRGSTRPEPHPRPRPRPGPRPRPPRQSAIATVAKGCVSAPRSLDGSAAHEYLIIQMRSCPCCYGAQVPQPRGRKNNPESRERPAAEGARGRARRAGHWGGALR